MFQNGPSPAYQRIVTLLDSEARDLLDFSSPRIPKQYLHLPGPGFVDHIWGRSDRSEAVRKNLRRLFGHGRLAGTGYLSILPIDQGIEHSAGGEFSTNPLYFDPENIIRLAMDGGCNGVASSLGVLGAVSGKYARTIPFILKLNHNELLSFPNTHDQMFFASVEQAFNMGAAAVGATIYFGSPESKRQIKEVSEAFAYAHELGMATVLWCYVRNPNFTVDGVNYEASADLTGQANYLGASIEADIIKQKLPVNNGGYLALNLDGHKFGAFDKKMYTELASEHPIDLTRYQVLNCFSGRVGLISSGGPSGDNDLVDVVREAVTNKRAGGTGIVAGRKAFRRSFQEGVGLLHAIQDVYLCKEVTIA